MKATNMESALMRTARVFSYSNKTGEVKYLNFGYGTSPDGSINMTLLPSRHVFQMSYCTASGVFNKNQQLQLKDLFEIDSMTEIYNELLTADVMKAEKDLLQIYTELGEKNAEKFLTKRQKFMRKFFKRMQFPLYAQEGDELFKKIKLLSSLVASSSRRSHAHFAIVNSQLVTLLKDCEAFVYSPSVQVPSRGIYLAGNIGGVAIFVDPRKSWEENIIVLGRETRTGDIGVYWAEGEREVQEIAFSEYLNTADTRLVMRSYRSIFPTPNAEMNYMTQQIVTKKKPLWRRLIKV